MAVALALVCVVASARLNLLRAFELDTTDWRLALRASHPWMSASETTPALDDLVIVAITTKTIETLPHWGPTSLDRSTYIPVIDHLVEAEVRGIGMDVFFAGRADDPDIDIALAAALARAGNVTIVAGAKAETDATSDERITFIPPVEPIRSAARMVASPLLFRPDNVVRWVKTVQRDAEGTTAYLALSRALLQEEVTSTPEHIMINWAGPAGTVPTVPFEELYTEPVSPSVLDAVRGRFVLIGVTDEMKDLFSTPVGPMSGVEIHAQAAATMLSGKYISQATNTFALLVAIPACITIALVGRRRRHWVTWGLAGIVLMVWFTVGAFVFARFLIMLPLTGVAMAIITTGVVLSALQSETALASLARLWPSWVGEEGEQLEVTVLVCDMAGYTARSETTSPTEMMAMMREFFAIVDEVVGRYGGIAARRPGDAALVFFRPEEGRAHHARRAVEAARQLHRRLAERWPDQDIDFGITLTTGEVSLGWVGEAPPEPQILGDPVNVAFRLQSECRRRGCPILADWETATADPELAASMRPLGQVVVRNRSQPVQIFTPAEAFPGHGFDRSS